MLLIISVQPSSGRNGKARMGKTILHINKEAGIDFTRSCTAFNRISDAAAIGRDPTGLRKRERTVRFQQHRAFRQMFSQSGEMISLIFRHSCFLLFHLSKSRLQLK